MNGARKMPIEKPSNYPSAFIGLIRCVLSELDLLVRLLIIVNFLSEFIYIVR
jgi:hypothetical protein